MHLHLLHYRLVKEAAYYEIEYKENDAKLQQMKNDNKDKWDIKKFQEVVGESEMMIPDSSARRDKALDDLKDYVVLLKKEEDGNAVLLGCEWMDEAAKILGGRGSEAKENVKGGDDVVAETAVDGLKEGEAF